MDAGWFGRVEALMARMAGGDRSALFELYSGFGDHLATADPRFAPLADLALLGLAA